MRRFETGLFLVALLASSTASLAQDLLDPAEVEEPALKPKAEEPKAEAEPPKKEEPKKREATVEERRLAQLRQLEARLSVGQQLTPDEKRLIGQVAVRGESPAVRALASAILSWLSVSEASPALLAAASDESPLVRDQALQGLVALARRLEGAAADQALALSVDKLADPSDEVSCSAVRLLAALNPEKAAEEVGRRAPEAGDVRYDCWRRVVPMDPRAIEVPPPVEPRDAREPEEIEAPPPEVAPPPAPPTGDFLFISTAAATGFLGGGALPALFFPPRDTLTYTARRTTHAREEPSLLFSGATALTGALLVGGAAYGSSWLLGPMEVPAASSVVLGTALGTAAGLGAGLTFGLDGASTGLLSVGGALGGLTLSAGLGFLLPPTGSDVGFAVGLAGQAALASTLLAITIVPAGADEVITGATRTNFALGTGLFAGGVAGVGGLMLAPLVGFSPGRVMVASAAGASAASLGVGVVYLFTPTSVTIRERIASGVGVGLQLIAATTAFVLLPGDWADAIAGDGGEAPATSALFLDEEKLRFGLPTVSLLPTERGADVGVSLFGGRF